MIQCGQGEGSKGNQNKVPLAPLFYARKGERMITITDVDVWGFKHAIRGMRNPMNSWDKSDSYFDGCLMTDEQDEYRAEYIIGENDGDLMHRLFKAGTEHRKYMRQIMVSMDIIAPLYWWKEFDTYKIGTVANSCSTMHKIADKEFELKDFSCEHLSGASMDYLEMLISWLNDCRKSYIEQKHKEDWWQMIQLLPSSYNQRRTVTLNYEVAATIIRQRTGHKLDEWHTFVAVLLDLPCMDSIINGDWGEN